MHVRARPAPGWLACRVRTRFVIDGYHEEDFEIWDSAGRLVPPARAAAVAAPLTPAIRPAGLARPRPLGAGAIIRAPAWIDRIGTGTTSRGASC